MVLYLCLIPNRGARIGHQTHEYFSLLTFCKKMNYKFVFHDFMCNSSEFNELLQFHKIHEFNYNDVKNNMRVINVEEIINDFNKLISINLSEENICVYGQICGHEDLIPKLYSFFNINVNDIKQIKLEHIHFFTNNRMDLKITDGEYITIHLRCGDVINDKSRYLNVDYFINQYKKLVDIYPNDKQLPIYVITEYNFTDDEYLKEHIPKCIIIKENALISSRSGFSNLAYILGNCQVIKPPDDWNDYFDNLIDLNIM